MLGLSIYLPLSSYAYQLLSLHNIVVYMKPEVKVVVMLAFFTAGVMKRVLRSGMGPSIQDYIISMKQQEGEKPDEEKRRFEEDDIQMACMFVIYVEYLKCLQLGMNQLQCQLMSGTGSYPLIRYLTRELITQTLNLFLTITP